MITEFEIQRAISFIFLTFDCKITEDLRMFDTDERMKSVRNNTIYSPYGESYIQNYGIPKYGSITPIGITIIQLNKMMRSSNYVELANNITANMHSPIDIAYYFHFCGVWAFFHTNESYTHHLNGTPNVNRSQFFAQQSQRYIRIAVEDIINNDLGGGDDYDVSDLTELIHQQIIQYLYFEGSFKERECLGLDDVDNGIMDGINYPQVNIDHMIQQTGGTNNGK